ncbi:MAG: V-type ATP synthase subunit D [bacterium]
MRLNVNPNRMILQRLRKRLDFARRGHHLLKDKLEGLIKEFSSLVDAYRKQRILVDTALPEILKTFLLAKATSSSEEIIEDALNYPKGKLLIRMSEKSIMNVMIPQLTMEGKVDSFSYGLMNTPLELDSALTSLQEIFPEILKMAELEATVRLMAQEIGKIRRRVNALEYFLIPQLEETVRFIRFKLDEIERSNNSRLMKIKDIIRAH